MRSLAVVFVVAAILVLAIVGCQKPSNQKASPAQAKTADAASPWKMTFATAPAPPVSGKDTVFRVTLTDTAGQNVSGAQVKASLVMPLMDMGKNEVTFTEQRDANYEGSGKFTMSGPWNVVITASAQGKSGQQTFPVVVHTE